MFEAMDREALAQADTAALVATIAAASRAEAAAAGTRLAAIAELLDRNVAEADAQAVFDGFAGTTAEVGAALGISPRRAAGQVHLAKALRHRLPKVAELLSSGAVSERVASTICWRTYLVAAEAAPAIDAALVNVAEAAGVQGGLGRLSDTALNQAIDAAIATHDPDATRIVHQAARRRDIRFGKPDDQLGTTSFFGSLHSSDATLVSRTIDELIATVCAEDPRTVGERRSDAMGVLAGRGDQLPCRCNRPECPQRGAADRTRASSAVIHVLADRAAIEAAIHEAATQPSIGTPWLNAQRPPTWIFTPQANWTDTHTPEQIADMIAAANPHQARDRMAAAQTEVQPPPRVSPAAHRRSRNKPRTAHCRPAPRQAEPPPPKPGGTAVLLGGSIVPGPLLAELVRTGAKVTAVKPPRSTAEPQYRPSSALAWFVRARDMTCCFPGCNAPAERCDIDHRIPWPNGPTHPGNTGCFCRTHHLAKTFAGWSAVQAADGTVTWTSPHGASYLQAPGASLVFPDWNTETPLPSVPRDASAAGTAPGRGLAMPQRRRTRAAEEHHRIKAEREANRVANLAYDRKMEEAFSKHQPTSAQPPPESEDEPPF